MKTFDGGEGGAGRPLGGLVRSLGVPLAAALALGGQALLARKGASPLLGLIPGTALYLGAAALLLAALARAPRGGSAPEHAAGTRPLPRGLEWTLVGLVLAGGLVLRLHRIDIIPWGLNNDEAINAIETQEIAAGKPFSTFTERGLNRETMFHYLGALSFRSPWLGLNLLRAMPAAFDLQPVVLNDLLVDLVFPLRGAAVAAGVLTILALYLFARDRFGWRVALLAAVFLAVSPWHLLYSRVGERAILAPLFAIAAAGLFLKAMESGRLSHHLAWGAAVGLGCWSYTSFRAIPLAIGAFLLLRWWRGRRAPGGPAGFGGRPLLIAWSVAAALVLAEWLFSRLTLVQFLFRGAYAGLVAPKANFGLNLFHALTMANYVPERYAVIQSDAFISDGMSATYGLIGLEPETLVVAALGTLGILCAAWGARGAWRGGAGPGAAGRRGAACALVLLCGAALLATVGTAGPSLTRMLQNLPWLCLCAALFADHLFASMAALRPPLTAWLGAALVAGLAGGAAAQGYDQYFLRAGRSEQAMQHFGAPQTVMGMFVRALPPERMVYILHTLRVDTLKYLIGDRPDTYLISDPALLDLDAIVKMPRTVTLVVEYSRPFAEPLRYLITRYPLGDMTQVADRRLDPDKIIFFTFTLWKDAQGRPVAPPGAPLFPGVPGGAPPS
jgi:hypothetical protein